MKRIYSLVLMLLCVFVLAGCGSDKKDKIETLTCDYVVGTNTLTYEYTYKNDKLDAMLEVDMIALDVEEDEYDDYVDLIEVQLKEAYDDMDGVEFKLIRYENKKNLKLELKADPNKFSDEEIENSEIIGKTIDELKEYYENQEFICKIK